MPDKMNKNFAFNALLQRWGMASMKRTDRKFSIPSVERKPRHTGFTLIEVMITVAIIAILSAVALPIYSSYVIRGNRTAAQAYLADIASHQQQYLMDARTYTDTLTDLNMSPPSEVSRYYTITITKGTAPPSFVVTATPIAGSRQASDVTLSIDNASVKLPAGTW